MAVIDARYLITEEGRLFCAVFNGDWLQAALEVEDSDPLLLDAFAAAALADGNPLVAEWLNVEYCYGRATTIEVFMEVDV